MNFNGKIHEVKPIEMKGQNADFKTRKLILDRTTEFQGRRYENYTEITLLGDKADYPEQLSLQKGDVIKCDGDVRGRYFQHEGVQKFAQDMEVWKIEVESRTATPAEPAKPTNNENPYA